MHSQLEFKNPLESYSTWSVLQIVAQADAEFLPVLKLLRDRSKSGSVVTLTVDSLRETKPTATIHYGVHASSGCGTSILQSKDSVACYVKQAAHRPDDPLTSLHEMSGFSV